MSKYCTLCTMESALALLHLPWLKLPQVPRRVPKLANLIEEITWFEDGQLRERVGVKFFGAFESEPHISIGNGWDSDTCEHKLPICLVAKESCVGSPPISSNNTRMLPLGCNHERGTWYLQVRQIYHNKKKFHSNFQDFQKITFALTIAEMASHNSWGICLNHKGLYSYKSRYSRHLERHRLANNVRCSVRSPMPHPSPSRWSPKQLGHFQQGHQNSSAYKN